MYISVEIGTFDNDLVVDLNYIDVFRDSFALRGRDFTHFFICCFAVDHPQYAIRSRRL